MKLFHQLSMIFTFLALMLPYAYTIDDYELGPESIEQNNIPKGTITMFNWESKFFAGTTRACWIYVPKEYNGKEPLVSWCSKTARRTSIPKVPFGQRP